MMRRHDRVLDPRGLGWSLAALIAAVLPHSSAVPAWIPAGLLAVGLWRWLAEQRRWSLPPRWLLVAIGLIGLGGVLADFHTINGLEAGTALLIVMATIKLLETRRRRDQWVLALIACFLLLSAFLRSQSPAMAVYGLLALWFITIAWLEISYQGGNLAWHRAVRLSARYAVQALPLALLLFLFFPRIPGAFWALPSQGATSGLSERMSPGDISDLALSDDVAFRVEFDGPLPAPAARYWRGPVLHEFDGRSWSRQPIGDFAGPAAPPGAIDYRGEPLHYRLTLEPHRSRYVLALDLPLSLPSYRGLLRYDYELVVNEPIQRTTSFALTSHPQYIAGLRLPEGLRDYDTRLPAGRNPRTRELALAMRRGAADETQFIGRILAMFREQEFFYTLEPRRGAYDAVDDFMFETRQGFCGHFASAFAVMMRAVGIPARVVTGYQGGQYNPLGGYLIVRQSDAHAWVELWLPGQGWRRVDPTAAVAPERIEQGGRTARAAAAAEAAGGRGWFSRAGLAWDAFQQSWNRWVVQFGPGSQRALAREFGLPDADWQHLTALLLGAMIVASIGLTLLLALEYRPRRRDEARRLYDRYCRKLAALELRRPAHETPSAHLERVARERPELAPAARAIVRLYLRLRYEPEPEREELSRLRHLVNCFRTP